ncbi:MAG: hypothetical protein RIQ34_851 [Bacteroidota bacterium]|jgi:DNA-directed RNA polymerase subunit delta
MLMQSTSIEKTNFSWQVSSEGVLTLLAAKKSKSADEEEDEPEKEDEWEKTDEEDSWDPDFDEFDVPKSRTAKSAGKKEEEDLNFEEEEDLGLFEDEAFGDEGGSDDDF